MTTNKRKPIEGSQGTQFVLMSGRHYRPGPDGKQIRFLPGDILELTPEELGSFGDKFLRLDIFEQRIQEFVASQESEARVKELVEASKREAAEIQEAARDAPAQQRGAQIAAMSEAEQKAMGKVLRL
ncbi:MAG: hypothetical protein ACRDHG_01775 [Anaerolineales bacterium]